MALYGNRSIRLVSNWREYLFFLTVVLCGFISSNSPRPQIATLFNWPPTSLSPARVYAQKAPPISSPVVISTPLPTPVAIAHAKGSKRNSYIYGQCTYYVATRRSIPNRWGNASNWYWRAQNAGWKVGSEPAVGAVAWTSAGWAGHVAYVEAVKPGHVLVSEMNYSGNAGRRTERWVTTKSFLYIY